MNLIYGLNREVWRSLSIPFFSSYVDCLITEDFNELKQVYNTVISTIFIHDFNSCTFKVADNRFHILQITKVLMPHKNIILNYNLGLQSLSGMFHLVHFVKWWQIFLELNSKRLYQSSGKENESRCLVFTSSIKREIRHFHVVVVQRRQRNVQKSVMHVQSCCFSSPHFYIGRVGVLVHV